MDKKEIKTTLLATFATVKDFDEATFVWDAMLHDTFGTHPSGSKIAVKVTPTDIAGCYDLFNVYVYDSYANALDKINELEYKSNTAVEVLEINASGYSHIMCKYFDGVCYSRLAQVKFQPWEKSHIKKLIDNDAVVYKVNYIKYV